MNEEMLKAMAGKQMSDKTRKMPELAIVENNTLAAIGLKGLLESAMPMIKVQIFGTFGEFESNAPEHFMHYFVSMHQALAHRNLFIAEKHRHHTIVLTPSNDPNSQLQGFHCICTNVPEAQLIKEIVSLQRSGHPHGEHIPQMEGSSSKEKGLTDREIEVLSLVAQGKINKEIADQLCIGLTTVITHRKNIQEKLGLKSVSSLTIYAVMHGYVDINKI